MNGLRRATWLLFTLLVAVAVASYTEQRTVEQTPPALYHTSQRPTAPDIVMPSGVFADVFEMARPATLRIETRSPVVMGGPLGVGTGFFISADGFVLTAYHVVDPTESRLRESNQARYRTRCRYPEWGRIRTGPARLRRLPGLSTAQNRGCVGCSFFTRHNYGAESRHRRCCYRQQR